MKAKLWQLPNKGKEPGTGPTTAAKARSTISELTTSLSEAHSVISELTQMTSKMSTDMDIEMKNCENPALARQEDPPKKP
jgi:hypothetical protein